MTMGISEVVKEYTLFMELYQFTVKGRIVRDLHDGKFYWDVSHFYKPSENADLNIPSTRSSDVYEDVERWLMKYLKEFKEIGVKKNELY